MKTNKNRTDAARPVSTKNPLRFFTIAAVILLSTLAGTQTAMAQIPIALDITKGNVAVTFTGVNTFNLSGFDAGGTAITNNGLSSGNVVLTVSGTTTSYAITINGGGYTHTDSLNIELDNVTISGANIRIGVSNSAYVLFTVTGTNNITTTSSVATPFDVRGANTKAIFEGDGTLNITAPTSSGNVASLGASSSSGNVTVGKIYIRDHVTIVATAQQGMGAGEEATANLIEISGYAKVYSDAQNGRGSGIGGSGSTSSGSNGAGGEIIIKDNAVVLAFAGTGYSGAGIGGGESSTTTPSNTIITILGNAKVIAGGGNNSGTGIGGANNGGAKITIGDGTDSPIVYGVSGSYSSNNHNPAGIGTGKLSGTSAVVEIEINSGFVIGESKLAGGVGIGLPTGYGNHSTSYLRINGGNVYAVNSANTPHSIGLAPKNSNGDLVYPVEVATVFEGGQTISDLVIPAPAYYNAPLTYNAATEGAFFAGPKDGAGSGIWLASATPFPAANYSAVLWLPVGTYTDVDVDGTEAEATVVATYTPTTTNKMEAVNYASNEWQITGTPGSGYTVADLLNPGYYVTTPTAPRLNTTATTHTFEQVRNLITNYYTTSGAADKLRLVFGNDGMAVETAADFLLDLPADKTLDIEGWITNNTVTGIFYFAGTNTATVNFNRVNDLYNNGYNANVTVGDGGLITSDVIDAHLISSANVNLTMNVKGGTLSKTNGGHVIFNGFVSATGGTVTVSGTANIRQYGGGSAGGGIAINRHGGTLTISGGSIWADGTSTAIYNQNGIMTVSGNATLSGGFAAIVNFSHDANAITVSGGTISTTTGTAIYSNSYGTITITGGELSATTGYAINNNNSTVNITGGTITSYSNSSTIYDSGGTIILQGGTVTNTKITAPNNAVYVRSGFLTLGGDPIITGVINVENVNWSHRKLADGTTPVGVTAFNPSEGKVYDVTFASDPVEGDIFVADKGDAFTEFFGLTNDGYLFTSDYSSLDGTNPGSGKDIMVAAICTSPSIPTPAAFQKLCTGATVADLTPANANVRWYSESSDDVALDPTVALTNGVYYVSEVSGDCESGRAEVTVFIGECFIPVNKRIKASFYLPEAPFNITAPTGWLCPDDVIELSCTDFGALDYQWILPVELAIISGQGTTTIQARIVNHGHKFTQLSDIQVNVNKGVAGIVTYSGASGQIKNNQNVGLGGAFTLKKTKQPTLVQLFAAFGIEYCWPHLVVTDITSSNTSVLGVKLESGLPIGLIAKTAGTSIGTITCTYTDTGETISGYFIVTVVN
jgi:hypothetical protein